MIVVRNVFRCKPGKARELVRMFHDAMPELAKESKLPFARILSDIAATSWTVVIESEAESLEAWEKNVQSRPQLRSGMLSYMDLVEEGHREIWKVEYEHDATGTHD
jgi:hypothetical protein